jgi:hypothetical protein
MAIRGIDALYFTDLTCEYCGENTLIVPDETYKLEGVTQEPIVLLSGDPSWRVLVECLSVTCQFRRGVHTVTDVQKVKTCYWSLLCGRFGEEEFEKEFKARLTKIKKL